MENSMLCCRIWIVDCNHPFKATYSSYVSTYHARTDLKPENRSLQICSF
uniref:Uncharacterized protein n=1 Tax=Aegilops tauschii subsp. strangulata TaxID=200361 RepID=A0A453KLV3_AEGTS